MCNRPPTAAANNYYPAKNRVRCAYRANNWYCGVQPLRINEVYRIPADICVSINPPTQANRVGLGISSCAWAVVPVVIIVQPGLCVIQLPWEAWVVGECAEGGGVLVGLGDAKGVGVVPAPEHLVVGGTGDDSGCAEVVGKHVVDAGGDGDRQGLDGIGGYFAGTVGIELNGDDAGGGNGFDL